MKSPVALVLALLAGGCSLIDDFGKFSGAASDLANAGEADLLSTDPPDLLPPQPDLSTVVPDLTAPQDGPVDLAGGDLTCVPGCVNKVTLTTCKAPPVNCPSGCVPAGGGLDAHCALAPTAGDLCAGKYAKQAPLAGGTWVLEPNPMNNNAPRLRLLGQGTTVDGALVQNHAVFCLEALTQADANWLILDLVTIGYAPSVPLLIVTQNEVDLPNLVLWAVGESGDGTNTSGRGRNGAGSGAPAGTDAPALQHGGKAGSVGMMATVTAGGGGGGSRGGAGGTGAFGGGGGAAGTAPMGLVGGGGGGGGGAMMAGGAGGAGSGVIQIAAGTKLRIGGAIYAMGGRGAHGLAGTPPGGGGGGGGGGAVLLESPIIEYVGAACAMVNGGYGGGGAGITTPGSGGSYQVPNAASCPLVTSASSGGNPGGGPGGTPVTMQPRDARGENGTMTGSGGGGAGGPGSFRQRALKITGKMTVYPDSPDTNINEPY